MSEVLRTHAFGSFETQRATTQLVHEVFSKPLRIPLSIGSYTSSLNKRNWKLDNPILSSWECTKAPRKWKRLQGFIGVYQ
jgi:hypothetical protein